MRALLGLVSCVFFAAVLLALYHFSLFLYERSRARRDGSSWQMTAAMKYRNITMHYVCLAVVCFCLVSYFYHPQVRFIPGPSERVCEFRLPLAENRVRIDFVHSVTPQTEQTVLEQLFASADTNQPSSGNTRLNRSRTSSDAHNSFFMGDAGCHQFSSGTLCDFPPVIASSSHRTTRSFDAAQCAGEIMQIFQKLSEAVSERVMSPFLPTRSEQRMILGVVSLGCDVLVDMIVASAPRVSSPTNASVPYSSACIYHQWLRLNPDEEIQMPFLPTCTIPSQQDCDVNGQVRYLTSVLDFWLLSPWNDLTGENSTCDRRLLGFVDLATTFAPAFKTVRLTRVGTMSQFTRVSVAATDTVRTIRITAGSSTQVARYVEESIEYSWIRTVLNGAQSNARTRIVVSQFARMTLREETFMLEEYVQSTRVQRWYTASFDPVRAFHHSLQELHTASGLQQELSKNLIAGWLLGELGRARGRSRPMLTAEIGIGSVECHDTPMILVKLNNDVKLVLVQVPGTNDWVWVPPPE